MPRPIPIGIDDFRALREAGLEYVDKSDLIRQLLDRPGVQVVVLPRPRRFGKTLNLSMLRAWFEKRDDHLAPLFEGLSITRAGEAYQAHFQRYPVIFLSFKGTKATTFEDCWGAITRTIEALFREHLYLLSSPRLDAFQIRDFRAIVERSAGRKLYTRALLDLSTLLHAHHGEKVVILIDEYDEPIHAGHFHGYAPQILDFMWLFLGEGLKSNTHLFWAVVTGVFWVADGGLFPSLDNLGVYTLLTREFNDCFGFTEPEVAALLERHGQRYKLEAVRSWCNGYLFGGLAVYYPSSVLCFLERGDETPRPWWLSTSSNDLVDELLERHALRLQPVFEILLEGGSVERTLDENVVLSEARNDEDTLFCLLVFSGYLSAEAAPVDELGHSIYRLSIPNREVREVYATTFRRWMTALRRGFIERPTAGWTAHPPSGSARA